MAQKNLTCGCATLEFFNHYMGHFARNYLPDRAYFLSIFVRAKLHSD